MAVEEAIKTMNNQEIIPYIVNKIKTQFNPKKIIQFGSLVWGKPGEDSDIDLFIIMDSELRRDERARKVQKLFSDRKFPLDIIVYTPLEIEDIIKRGNPFIKEILSKGSVVYG